MKIYVCVEGGIVNDIYAEKDPADPAPEAIVLDVDSDRDDAEPIQARWDEVAADPAYERIPHEFYAPLEEG